MSAAAEKKRGYIAPSQSDAHRTPLWVIQRLEEMWGREIMLDPCASPEQAHWFAGCNMDGTCESRDGLTQSWADADTRFVNPPFSRLDKWTAKCAYESRSGMDETVLLLPSRTDTDYWHEHVATATALCLLKGRLKFIGQRWQAPFPVTLAYWGWRPWLFHRSWREKGMVVRP